METTSTQPHLELNEESISFLKETSKWTFFLSIIGFVFIGFIVLVGIFIGTIFSKLQSITPTVESNSIFESGLITFMYILIGLLYFFPVYYLFQFSTKLKKAIIDNDSELLASSLGFLKSHYKFIGILTIITLLFYAIGILISLTVFSILP